MARPNSSNLRPSATTPAFESHSPASHVDAHARPSARGESGPVPEENSPGHHPEHDQDKPDLDAFAARFSGRDLDDLPTDTGLLEHLDRASAGHRTEVSHALRRWAPPVAGFVAFAALFAIWLRRRRA